MQYYQFQNNMNRIHSFFMFLLYQYKTIKNSLLKERNLKKQDRKITKSRITEMNYRHNGFEI